MTSNTRSSSTRYVSANTKSNVTPTLLRTQYSSYCRSATGAIAITNTITIIQSSARDDIRRREGHDKRCRQGTAARELRIRIEHNGKVSAAARKQSAWSLTRYRTRQTAISTTTRQLTILYNSKCTTVSGTQ